MGMEIILLTGFWVQHLMDYRNPTYYWDRRPREYNNKGITTIHRQPKLAYYIVKEIYGKLLEKLFKNSFKKCKSCGDILAVFQGEELTLKLMGIRIPACLWWRAGRCSWLGQTKLFREFRS